MAGLLSALLLLPFLPSCHGASPGRPGSLAPELIEKIRAGGVLASDPSARYVLELQGPDDLPLVPVTLNGRGPFLLLLDFGANVVVLRPDTAERAGIEVLVEREGTDVGRAETMEIAGQLAYTDVHVGIDEGLRDVAGVVGFNVLRFASSRWDGPARRLEISPAIGVAADQAGSVPLKIESRMPYLQVRSGETELWANLDTGAAEWFTVPEADRGAFSWRDVREGPVTYNNQTGEQRVESAVFVPGLDVGTETLSGFPVYINPDADTPWFGMSLLRHCITTLDLEAERALLECELPPGLPTN